MLREYTNPARRVVVIGGPVEIVLVGLVVDMHQIVVITLLQFGAPGIRMAQPPSNPPGTRGQRRGRIGVAEAVATGTIVQATVT